MFFNQLSNVELTNSIFCSKDEFSITSISKLVKGNTELYYDKRIAHLYTKELINSTEYYDNEYTVDIEKEDKDSLYKVVDGKKIYRTQYQLELFLQKVNVKNGMKILDYGSAKGLFLRKLINEVAIEPYLFDITKSYEEFWKNSFKNNNFSFYTLKEEWKNSLDVVTSFYVFEHVVNPIDELKKINDVLKENGIVYIQVPNVYSHIADFICVDHLHHYSKISLSYLLNKSGFEIIDIDDSSYEGGLIIVGRKKYDIKYNTFLNAELNFYKIQVQEMALYWDKLSSKIHKIYRDNATKKAALYGAGFYSTYILSHLPENNNIQYVIDQNTHLHSQKFYGLDIVSSDNITNDIEFIFVGLNPYNAKNIISNISDFKNKDIEFFYLD